MLTAYDKVWPDADLYRYYDASSDAWENKWGQTTFRKYSENVVCPRFPPEVAGRNLLSSRTTLQREFALVFVGHAEKVLQVRNTLVSAGMTCEINPDFCWL